jgi:transposase
MAALPGIVSSQQSIGGKSTLGAISKRGNTYLRKLFIQGAQVLLINMQSDPSRTAFH